jgi:hypothetical protein
MKALILAGLCLAVATPSLGASIAEVEPNDTLGAAQNIDAFFTLDYSPDIGDWAGVNTSTVYPHVTVNGTGNGTLDYYSFTVPWAGVTGIFDIDYGWTNEVGTLDTYLAIWDSSGNWIAVNDDSSTFRGAGGSTYVWDSFIQYTFASPGIYTVGVAEYYAEVTSGGWAPISNVPDVGDTYVLQVSLSSVIPEPGTFVLLGLGVIGVVGMAYRRRKKSA